MANVPLKSITFPGLSDTYTVPQIDNTLTTSGKAADAKVVGDQLGDLKSAVEQISDDGNNLFDTTTVADGRLLSGGGIAPNTPDYFTSDYISVVSGRTYKKNSPSTDAYHRLCTYDSTLHFVRDVDNSNTVTIVEGEKYVRFSGADSELETTTFVYATAIDVVARASATEAATAAESANEGVESVENSLEQSFDYVSKEVYLKTDQITLTIGITAGGSSNPNVAGNTGVLMSAGDVIGILNTGKYKYAVYDVANSEFIENGGSAYWTGSCTIPSTGTYGMHVMLQTGTPTEADLEDMAEQLYRYDLTALNIYSPKGYCRLANKNGYAFGDSIWWQDGRAYNPANPIYNAGEVGKIAIGYPSLLEDTFGVNITNYAVSGAGIMQQYGVIIEKDYTNVDFVIIACGTNDFSGSTALGEYPTARNETLSTSTFIGAYCSAIEHILTENPSIKIILATPLQRDTTWRNSGVPDFSQLATDIFTLNGQGLKLEDYAVAIKNVGKLYGCVVCDMYSESGLNYLTLPKFTFEGVHPTNAGYQFTKPCIFNAFRSI